MRFLKVQSIYRSKDILILTALAKFLIGHTLLAQGSGKMIDFDGVNDFVQCYDSGFDIQESLTLESWIKTDTDNNMIIVSKHCSWTNRSYDLMVYNSGFRFAIFGVDDSEYILTGGSFKPGKWQHVAGVYDYDAGVMNLFVNGEKVGAKSIGNKLIMVSDRPLTIGAFWGQSGNCFATRTFYEGYIDEVRLWKRALTLDEIRKNMCQKIKAEQDLIAYFNFDELITDKDSYFFRNEAGSTFGEVKNVDIDIGWDFSGAPVGDKSLYNYGGSSEFYANDSLTIGRLNATGIHFYEVYSEPNFTTGLENTVSKEPYFGVFTTNYDTFKLNYFSHCKIVVELFFRAANSSTVWNKVDINTAQSDRGEYLLNPLEQDSILLKELSGPDYLCENEQVEIIAPEGIHYEWNTGHTSQQIKISKGGFYEVFWQDENGCESYGFKKIELYQKPDLSIDTVLCDGQLLTPAGLIKGFIITPINFDKDIKITGSYLMNIQDDRCSKIDTIKVRFKDCLSKIFIPNIITPGDNNYNEYFVIKGMDNLERKIEIFNRWGVLVYKNNDYKNNWNGESVGAGVFYFKLQLETFSNYFLGFIHVLK